MIALDSSFLVALHNARDVHHDTAVAVRADLVADRWGPALLLEYVLLEVATVVAMRCSHEAAVQVVDTLLGAREVEFVPCSDYFADTLRTFRELGHRKLSFVDAALVAVMRRRSVEQILSFDRGFDEVPNLTRIPAV